MQNFNFDFNQPASPMEQAPSKKELEVAWFKDLAKVLFWFCFSLNVALHGRDADDKTATWILLIGPKALATATAYVRKDEPAAKGEAIATAIATVLGAWGGFSY